MKVPYMIWYLPNGTKEEIKNINNLWIGIDDASKNTRIGVLSEDLKYENLRCVLKLNELKEKIRLFDNALDDRIIEIEKILLLSQFIRDSKYPDITLNTEMYFAYIDERNTVKHFNFTLINDDKFRNICVTDELYDGIKRNYSDVIPPKKKEYCLINREKTLELLLGMSK